MTFERCAKCGRRWPVERYCTGHHSVCRLEGRPVGAGEHMEYLCRCGYVWARPTRDRDSIESMPGHGGATRG